MQQLSPLVPALPLIHKVTPHHSMASMMHPSFPQDPLTSFSPPPANHIWPIQHPPLLFAPRRDPQFRVTLPQTSSRWLFKSSSCTICKRQGVRVVFVTAWRLRGRPCGVWGDSIGEDGLIGEGKGKEYWLLWDFLGKGKTGFRLVGYGAMAWIGKWTSEDYACEEDRLWVIEQTTAELLPVCTYVSLYVLFVKWGSDWEE